MKVLEWFGLSAREETPPEGSVVTIPAREVSVVTGDTALGIIDVYRAINIHVIAVQQLTLDVWRNDEPVERPSVVRRPDMRLTPSAWRGQNVASLATTGNAYWRITRDTRHRPINIEVLDPHLCTPRKDGRLGYKDMLLEADEFQHLKLMERAGHLRGLGPIQACRAELSGALDLRDYAAEWFRSGDVPTGVLKSDQQLTKEQADAYKAMWNERDKHGVAVTGAGLSYSPILLAPEDAQFLESRQFTKTEIATLFGIPAHMLLAAVEGTSLTYSNMTQADLAYVRWSLMGYLKPIEDAMTSVLTGLQEARFNLDGILRPDISTRYDAHGKAIKFGFLTINEVRAIEGLPPLDAPAPTPEPEATP